MSLVQNGQSSGCGGHSGIVVYGAGTLSLVQKGQTSGCSGHSGIAVYGVGALSLVQKGQTSGHSEIVYGIWWWGYVSSPKRSNL